MTALSDGIKIDNGFDHQPSPVFFAIAFRCFSGCLKSAVHFSRCFLMTVKTPCGMPHGVFQSGFSLSLVPTIAPFLDRGDRR
ncbi:hypothetical protein [Avibacterium paragallinarum]|uniref:hypothetical protein n=1 Tax=Avibacterium paragallinarum TaxID=728 RepID=UPI0011C01A11|nr:hypothetical protein [Avibacterium paragallinarum]